MSLKKKITIRSAFQVGFTLLTLLTAIAAFIFCILFQNYNDQLQANFMGEPKGNYLPCVRHTLDTCDNRLTDECREICCPADYICSISPVVGLLCMIREEQYRCGTCPEELCPAAFQWCRDFADISRQCNSEVCLEHRLVKNMAVVAFMLAGLGVLLDIVDITVFFAAPDSVVCKSVVNISASCVKWVSFGVVLGSGAQGFMSSLVSASCYNESGDQLVTDTEGILLAFLGSQGLSALLSLCLAPVSAYFGGKLVGVPYVPTR